MIEPSQLWPVIAGLALGSFAIRFVFLGFVDSRKLPSWVLRHLRYTAVAMIPALVAPLVIWPEATDGATDPARLIAALATLAAGMAMRNLMAAILTGGTVFYACQWLLG